MGLFLRTQLTLFEGLALDIIIVDAATVAVIPTVLTHSFSDF